MSKGNRVEYKCSKCGVTDYWKQCPEEQLPVALNCAKCGAGYKVDLADMVHRGIGMFPTGQSEEIL